MKSKNIGILGGLALLGLVAAIFVNQEPESNLLNSGELVFPLLMAEVNDIKEMVVETQEETITLMKGDQGWNVKEKGGYEADLEKVKKAIVGLAELRILEPKTKNPELYGRLGLQDKEKEGALSTFLTLKSSQNAEAAKLVVGNQRPAKGDPGKSDIYVRKPGNPQTWLVVGNLPLDKTANEWMDKEVTALTTKRVRQVTVTHPDGTSLHVTKDKPEDIDFTIDSIPAGFKVTSQFNVNNVPGTLGQLSFEDVKKESDVDFTGEAGVSAVLETFDGFRLHMQTMTQEDKVFAKFSAEYDQSLNIPAEETPQPTKDSPKEETKYSSKTGEAKPGDDGKPVETPKPETILKKPEDVKKEVENFNKRVKGWAYELPKFRVENFSKLKKDLIEKSS